MTFKGLTRTSSLFAAFATEEETAAEIKRVYDESDYIEDPHTAVASAVYKQYVEQTGIRLRQ